MTRHPRTVGFAATATPGDSVKAASDAAVREPTEGRSSWDRPPTKTVPPLKPREFGRWIWRQLVSMRTALVLLFVLAVAAVPGSLIPQEPVDPSAVTAFHVRHPSLSPIFDRIGMFHVYSSVWFSAVYLLLMASLVGCIIPRARVYARVCTARPPKAPRNLRRLSAYESWDTDEQAEVVSERARRVLSGQRRRVSVYSVGGEKTVVSAEKGYLREAGNLLLHCALIVVLVGVAITSLFGFQGSAAVVAVPASRTR
jgi:cytochrome c biogenesis protein